MAGVRGSPLLFPLRLFKYWANKSDAFTNTPLLITVQSFHKSRANLATD